MLDYTIYFNDDRKGGYGKENQLEFIQIKRGQLVTSQGKADLMNYKKVKELLTETFTKLIENNAELFAADCFKVYLRINNKDIILKSLQEFMLIFDDLAEKRYLKIA
jgi:hypothetical protein